MKNTSENIKIIFINVPYLPKKSEHKIEELFFENKYYRITLDTEPVVDQFDNEDVKCTIYAIEKCMDEIGNEWKPVRLTTLGWLDRFTKACEDHEFERLDGSDAWDNCSTQKNTLFENLSNAMNPNIPTT
ncbi:MAG: hypothetical protein IPO78_17260 [Saprospiraceae bacterium]|nr:hypothetical protein [Saprospiraceae bacterium]